jgi:hypothetical protein
VSAALRDNNSGTVIFFDVPVHLEAFFVEAAPMDRNLFVTTFKSLPDTAEVSNTVRPVCLCGKRLACCVGLCHGMGYAVCACNECCATQPFTFIVGGPFTFIVGGLVPLDPRTAGIVFNRAFFFLSPQCPLSLVSSCECLLGDGCLCICVSVPWCDLV